VDYPQETYISLCVGVGGLDLGVHLALPRAKCICYVEREAFCIAHLADKMEQGWLDSAPIWTDIKTFDGKPYCGKVRGLIGGYPCQPFSVAGKRRGQADERHLWPEIKRLVCEIRPDWCFFENVAGHLRLGFDRVLCDLAEIGYDAVWTVIAAGDVGATHQRKRLFILAYTRNRNDEGKYQRRGNTTYNRKRRSDTFESPSKKMAYTKSDGGRDKRGDIGNGRAWRGTEYANKASTELADAEPQGLQGGAEREIQGAKESAQGSAELGNANATRLQGRGESEREGAYQLPAWPPSPSDADAWRQVLEADPSLEPAICGVADGLASRIDRLRACGNGVVPIQAAVAFCTLVDIARRELK